MIPTELSEAVRRAVAGAADLQDFREAVDRARSAFIEADGVSLFGLETDHPELGTVHWIVGHPARDEGGYLVVAIASNVAEDRSFPLFAAAADELSDAIHQLAPDCGMPAAA